MTDSAPTRQLAIPATPGNYYIGDFRVIVRRRRDNAVWLKNERIRFIADQRGWSRTAFSRHTGVDNSYACPRIWEETSTRVAMSTAQRISQRLEVPLAEICHLTEDGQPMEPVHE